MGANDESRGRPAREISLGRPEALRLTAYGVVLLFLGVGVFSAVADVDTSTAQSVLLVGAFVATMILHEAIHGLCFLLFGGSPRFGMGVSFILPYLSTTSEGDRFDARQMTVIGLAPLVFLSIGTLVAGSVWPALAPYALVAFLANLSGSVGDIWIVARLRRFARFEGVTFEDRETGVAIWTDDVDVARAIGHLEDGTSTTIRFAARFGMATLVIFLTTVAVGIFTALSLPHDQAFRIGPAAFPLFEKQPTDGGLLVSVTFGPPVVGGLLFAVLTSGMRPPDRSASPRRRGWWTRSSRRPTG